MKSLYLYPRAKPITLPLSRWRNHPSWLHTIDTIYEFANVQRPENIKVFWIPLNTARLLVAAGDHPMHDSKNANEQQRHVDAITTMQRLIGEGDDIPPIAIEVTDRENLLEGGFSIVDGRHRSWAALHLGLKRIPVFEVPES